MRGAMRVANLSTTVSGLVSVAVFVFMFVALGFALLLVFGCFLELVCPSFKAEPSFMSVLIASFAVSLFMSLRIAMLTYSLLRWRVIETGELYCSKCDYNLKGNVSGRCPECGWEIPKRSQDERA